MAAKQKRNTRVQVTIDEETNEILEELYRLTGTPKATTIGEFVAGIKPHLRMSVDLLKKIKSNEMEMSDARNVFNNILADYGDVIHHAQGELNKVHREINKETDEELNNATNSRKSD